MQFTVTAQELITASTTCRNTNSEIQAQIGQMQSYVQGLMGAYQGTAATQLQSVSQQWHTDATQLNYVLDTIAQGLQSNANNYVTNEATNTSNLANVASGAPSARI